MGREGGGLTNLLWIIFLTGVFGSIFAAWVYGVATSTPH